MREMSDSVITRDSFFKKMTTDAASVVFLLEFGGNFVISNRQKAYNIV